MTDFHRLPDDHDCTRDETCAIPAFLHIQVEDKPDEVEYNMEVHRFTMHDIAAILVRLFDNVVVSDADDETPRIVSHSRAREILMQAAEQTPLTPEAAVSVEELLRMFTERAEKEE
jgi:hypothetical protein